MQTGMYAPPLGRINKIIIITMVAMFILTSLLEKFAGLNVTYQLGLSINSFLSGHIYQLITYPWVSHGLLSVVFNALILWFLGSEFESNWGFRRYLYFILGSALIGGVIFLLVGLIFLQGSALGTYPLSGLSGVASALCLAYAIIYPDRMFTFMLIFPMKARYFCMILIGIELYQGFFSPSAILSWGHLGTMLGGFIMMTIFSRKTLKMPKFEKKRKVSKNSHLRIVKEDENDPKYFQ